MEYGAFKIPNVTIDVLENINNPGHVMFMDENSGAGSDNPVIAQIQLGLYNAMSPVDSNPIEEAVSNNSYKFPFQIGK